MEYIPPLNADNPTDPYVNKNPAAGTNGSYVSAEVFNAFFAELLAVIQAGPLVPDRNSLTQVRDAILAMIAAGGGTGGGDGVPLSRLIATTEGLQGGGDLNADRTLKLAFAALAAAGALANDDLVAIWSVANNAHRKVTLSDLAAALATVSSAADIYTETNLALAGTLIDVDPLPNVADRLLIGYQTTATIYGPALLQAYCGGAWVTVASLAKDTVDGELASTVDGIGSVGLKYAPAAPKLWALGTPGRAYVATGVLQTTDQSGTSYIQKLPIGGHPFTVARQKSAAAWNGQLRVSGAGSITSVKKYSPLVTA